MAGRQPFPPGTRRTERPAASLACATCDDLAGRGYPECPDCARLVDGFWYADWHALLDAAKIPAGGQDETEFADGVLAAPVGLHAWTCVDWAMSLIACPECGTELGTGPPGCVLCGIADETRWSWDHAAPPGAITPCEHALRRARTVLRAPHRHRRTVVLDWRLALPFLLTGQSADPATAQWIRAYLRSGRYAELASADSYGRMAGVPGLPWRVSHR